MAGMFSPSLSTRFSARLVTTTALCTILLSAVSPAQAVHDRRDSGVRNTTWTPCQDDPSYLCGTIVVPLDWSGKSTGNATIGVVKYSATQSNRKGSIFVNPGGPGDSGTDFILGMGDTLSGMSGGYYDIIGFDPRGVGLTTPRIACFNSTKEEAEFWQGTIPSNGIEAKGNFTSLDGTDPDVQAFWAQVPEVDKLLAEVGQRCLEINGNNLEFVGTAAVVRDIAAMTDAYDGAGSPINYWGFSYGTVIGMYLVNIFPDRVGRVIIDGVVNTVLWADYPSYEAWPFKIQDTPHVFEGFAGSCAMAGPAGCAIAEKGSTNASVVQWVQNLLDAAYDYYKAGGEISSANVRNLIFQAMYTPTTWPDLATQLYEIAGEIYNGTSMKRGLGGPEFPGLDIGPLGLRKMKKPLAKKRNGRMWSKRETNPLTYDYAFQAITCADSLDPGNTTTYDVFAEILGASQNVSEMFGPSFGDGGFWCHKWPARAVERYTGPWNATTKNKILVIGNVADPITPFPGAQLVAEGLLGTKSAVLVEQNDYGHTSLAEHSDCTAGIITNFFVNGTYPTEDQFCGTNQILFPGGRVTKQSLENGGSIDPKFNPNVPIPGSTGKGSGILSVDYNNTNTNTTTQNNDPSNDTNVTDLQNEINHLKDTRRTLYIALGSVVIAFLCSILALVFTICCRRKPSYSGSSSGGGGGGGYSNKRNKPSVLNSSYTPIGHDEKDIDHTPRGVVHHQDLEHDEASDAFIPPASQRIASERVSGGGYTDPYDPPSGAIGASSYGNGGRGY